MKFNILIGIITLLLLFFAYVATREGFFHYERSGWIDAPAEKIFPYISTLKLGEKWSPYENIDPNMKKIFSGTDAKVGAKMNFKGNSKAGTGSIEIIKLIPNESVELRLIMTAPLRADNIVRYSLKPEINGTRFTWSMEGDGGYLGKLVTLFIDCEKMVASQFEKGISNLKALIEAK